MTTQIRLNTELVQKAEQQGELNFRPPAKQIEVWANIGKEVESFLTPADRSALFAGEVEVRVIRKKSMPINIDSVFANVESDRADGVFKEEALKDNPWYEASADKQGHLIQVNPVTGKRTLGIFKKGVFVPDEKITRIRRPRKK